MTILRPAVAGTLESSDCMVRVEPGEEDKGVNIEIESVVLEQYGAAIRAVAERVAEEKGLENGNVFICDKGAFDCVIAARMEIALIRASKEGERV